MKPETASAGVAEFTFKAVFVGVAFGLLFGAANAYLGLKSGLTVSTSIPIAVLAAAVFKLLPKGGTILEANISQTVGSASSSLASGTIFTIPALFMWGVVPPLWQVAMLAFAGGLLGILAMVPLRRLLIVQADAELPYPEGRACAEVLRTTQKAAAAGKWIFVGIAVGFVIKIAVSGAHWLPENVSTSLGYAPNASLAIAIAPALLAVGYIVGFRSATVMVAGGFIASLVLYPLVTKAHLAGAADAGNASMTALGAGAVKSRFLVFLGAGAVAAAGLVTIARTAPTMVRSFRSVVAGVRGGAGAASTDERDRDLPATLLLVGIVSLFAGLALVPGLLGVGLSFEGRLAAALGVVIFGLLFVPVSSRLVGAIGVSSNPTSAMALITLAGTAGVFLLFGWTDLGAKAAVLTVGTVVCVAASKAGDISQDLKTGWLVGGKPYLQQYGQLIAAACACWVVAGVVIALGTTGGGYGEGGLLAPQATLMKTVIEAVLGGALPWDLLAMGGGLSFVGTLVGLPALPFALGIYLPLSTLACVFVGGCLRRYVESRDATKVDAESGILCASGFVAGEGLAGVGIAGYVYAQNLGRYKEAEPTHVQVALALGALALAAFVLYRSTVRRRE